MYPGCSSCASIAGSSVSACGIYGCGYAGSGATCTTCEVIAGSSKAECAAVGCGHGGGSYGNPDGHASYCSSCGSTNGPSASGSSGLANCAGFFGCTRVPDDLGGSGHCASCSMLGAPDGMSVHAMNSLSDCAPSGCSHSGSSTYCTPCVEMPGSSIAECAVHECGYVSGSFCADCVALPGTYVHSSQCPSYGCVAAPSGSTGCSTCRKVWAPSGDGVSTCAYAGCGYDFNLAASACSRCDTLTGASDSECASKGCGYPGTGSLCSVCANGFDYYSNACSLYG